MSTNTTSRIPRRRRWMVVRVGTHTSYVLLGDEERTTRPVGRLAGLVALGLVILAGVKS